VRNQQCPNFEKITGMLRQYAEIKRNFGALGVAKILANAESALLDALNTIKALPADPGMASREPDDLDSILRLRPEGPRRFWTQLNAEKYRERLEGAFIGRLAGCTLGAPVEMFSVLKMQNLARETGEMFPPTDYWKYCPDPFTKRYGVSPIESYTRGKMDGVPVDDDIAYTVLGLLIMEEFGPDFRTGEVGKAWKKYLPLACGPEGIVLDRLRKGCAAEEAAEEENPYWEGLGANIRSDPWGYLAPGWPERAAQMAYHDASLSHRRQGVYSAMFFAAAISAAFAVDDPREVFEIALTEIPADSAMAQGVRWALGEAPRIKDHRQARLMVDERFGHLHAWHAVPNACLTIWGVTIGGRDFTRVIGETVAMGWDNDCTAATAGSICGAAIGKNGIPEHWYRNFNNCLHSYLIGYPRFSIDNLCMRFEKQAAEAFKATV
jgi:ADP-ribosylglycohydrolase